MVQCVFCQILTGEKQVKKVYEDEDFIAFLDQAPVFLGHTLLIPKKHVETIWDLDKDIASKLVEKLKIVSAGVKNATQSDGILIVQNNVVSQSVPHIHFHIIPRKFHDGLRGFLWPRRKYSSEEEENEYANKIKEEIAKLVYGNS